jgi:zinc/manganese transport system substrate-binding protein
VCTGAELEIGWLPQLVRQSGNDKLAGGAGVFAAASVVKTLQKPAVLDRAPATCIPRAIRTSRWTRTACSRWRRCSTRASCSSIRPTPPRTRSARRLRRPLVGGDQALGSEGRAAQGRNVVVHHDSWIYLTSGWA